MTNEERPNAKFLRLQNGDDLIAEIIETEDEKGILYTLFHPLKVIYTPSDTDGYLSVMFMPWVFPRICDQQEFFIHAEDVLLVSDVAEKMNIYYWDSVDVYMERFNESSSPEQQEVQQEEEQQLEQEVYNHILEQLSNKRTFH